MTFTVYYIGVPGWHKEYHELDTIELFFKKYFEEMLAKGEIVQSVGPHLFHVRR